MSLQGVEPWQSPQELTERIEREDPTLTDIRLAILPPSPPSGLGRTTTTTTTRTTNTNNGNDDNTVGAVQRLESAIRAHAANCRGVQSFAVICPFFSESMSSWSLISSLLLFRGVRDIQLESPQYDTGGGSGAAGSFVTPLSLDFVARRICWPRTRRVALWTTLGGGHVGGGVLAGPLPPEALAKMGVWIGRALQLEEFAAPRLDVPNPHRWHQHARLVETLAGLPLLRTLHLGHVGHTTGNPLLGLEVIRSLARSPTLETINLVRFGFDDDSVEAFCYELLKSDATTRIRHVEFDDFIPQITRAGCISFWNLLTVNTTITHLHIHCTDEEESAHGRDGPSLATLEEDIQAMCRINGAEPRALLAGPPCASSDDWLRLLEAAGDSLGATFWLLQKYPGLVSTRTTQSAPSRRPASPLLGKHELQHSMLTANAKRPRTH